MAVTAKFQADFASFYSAVEKAEVELRGLETGAAKVEKSLNRAADSFSGRKIIQDANLAAAAIDKIGGASKLTESEQRKVNAAVTEAIAKYKALGIEAPQHLQKLANETKAANSSVGSISASLKGLAATLGVTFSVVALKAFVMDTLAAAGQIDDLSKKIGVSAEAVQRWKFAAEQGGSSIETVGKAVANMNKELADGPDNKTMVGALKLAGLEFTKIRQMTPEAAFNTIVEAIEKIEDPMLRARVAFQAFGKAGLELLPSIVEGFKRVGDSSEVMKNDTVARLAAAEDAWGRLKTKVVIHSGEILNATIQTTERATSSWSNFFKMVLAGPGAGFAVPGSWFATTPPPSSAGPKTDPKEQERQRQQAIRDAIAATEALAREELARQKATQAAEKYAEAQARIRAAMTPLSEEQVKQIEQLSKLGVSYSDIAIAIKAAEVQVKSFLDTQKAMNQEFQSGLTTMPGLQFDIDFEGFKERADAKIKEFYDGFAATAPDAAAAAEAPAKAIEDRFSQTFTQITVMARSSAQLIRDALITELDAELNAQNGLGFISQIQRQAAAQMRNRAGVVGQYEQIPGFANGVSNFRGGAAWVGERGPELVTLPKGSSVTPNHALSGMTVNVYVSGSTDASTGRTVGEQIIQTLRAKGVRV